MTIRPLRPSAMACLILLATTTQAPVLAQGNAELVQELNRLKARIEQLENQLRAPIAATPAVDPEEFNRIRVKVEANEDNTDTLGFKGLKISGMIDPTYVYNRRQNSSGFVFLNNFDGSGRSSTAINANLDSSDRYAYDNSYFGMAVLDLQKETESSQKWRLTLAPHKSASSGYNIGSIVHEASVSVPVAGPSTRLIAGQFPDWTGYEYFFSNQQPLISHNLLFDFTIPSFYSGAGMELTRGKWVSKFIAGNINQARRTDYDPSDTRGFSKTPGMSFRVDYARGEFMGFGFAGSHSTGSKAAVTQGEIDGYFIRGPLTIQGQIGSGSAQSKASNGGTARWTGVSALGGYKVTPRMQLIARGDYIWNERNGGGLWGAYGDATGPDGRNGVGLPMGYNADSSTWTPTGLQGVNRYALALGVNYLIEGNHTSNSGLWNTGTWFKAELRYDGASGPVFYDVRDRSWHKNNLMFATSLVFAF